MSLEKYALSIGTHAHVLVLQSLFYIYGLSLMGLCKRTGVLEDSEMPDLEPALSRLPRDMRDAICRAVRAEQGGHCAIHEDPDPAHLRLLESKYIWAYEAPLWRD